MTISYFENHPMWMPGTSTWQLANASQLKVQPFILPDNMTIGAIRIPQSCTHVSTTFVGTTDNTTVSCARILTHGAVIYSQGVGASSASLMSVFSAQNAWTMRTYYAAGGTGSEYTISLHYTFPPNNQGTASTYSTSYAVSSTRINISTESGTLFTGAKFVDLATATSLSAGNYWIGYGISGSNSAGDLSAATAAFLRFTDVGVSQTALTFGHLAAATNASDHLQIGNGIFSTDSAIFSFSAIPLANISITNNHRQFFFQMFNRA